MLTERFELTWFTDAKGRVPEPVGSADEAAELIMHEHFCLSEADVLDFCINNLSRNIVHVCETRFIDGCWLKTEDEWYFQDEKLIRLKQPKLVRPQIGGS